jgi:hypothetical protein
MNLESIESRIQNPNIPNEYYGDTETIKNMANHHQCPIDQRNSFRCMSKCDQASTKPVYFILVWKMQGLTQEEIDSCRAAFLTFDKDRSGTIDAWELRQVLEQMGEAPTEDELFQVSEIESYDMPIFFLSFSSHDYFVSYF